MANTYSKLLIHLIFVVKRRDALIDHKWKEELFKYTTGIITNKHQKLLAVNAVPDHMHLLMSYKPDTHLPSIVRDIKSNTSKFINENNLSRYKFEWQIGYAAFSVGHSQVDIVVNYIKNQEKHHAKKKFRDEYLEMLSSNEIDFEEKYLFSEPH
jgi:REP element-mobilizing transposase RayT